MRAYKAMPHEPLINLLIGVAYLSHVTSRRCTDRHKVLLHIYIYIYIYVLLLLCLTWVARCRVSVARDLETLHRPTHGAICVLLLCLLAYICVPLICMCSPPMPLHVSSSYASLCVLLVCLICYIYVLLLCLCVSSYYDAVCAIYVSSS
jgi:hypothetical protein